ncbi:MAG: hypothetical protein IKW78_06385, partial [Prevotella sp.]|nr:hypothetical protein [Prevotella sp.]
WLIHPADFTNTGTEDKWLYNKVLSYQENGLPAVVQLAPRYYMFGVGGWNQSQADGILTIVFPGVKVYDYSAEVSYVGMFTDPDGATSVWADLTLGADAKTAKAVIISQDADPAAVADAIAAGELEATDVEAGRIELPLPADANGKLQIVVAVIDGGEAKNVATAKFEYYSGASPWETVGVGYYTDDYIVSYYGEQDEAGNFVPYDPETYQVEIEANTSTPGLYRIKNAYAPLVKLFGEEGGEKDIEVHAEDPAGVYILQQPTGVDFGKGEFDIESYGGYLIAKNSDATPAEVIAYFAGKFGTLTDGVITFPVLGAQDGSTLQGYLYRGGELLYYGGTTGASQIVLPSASAQVKAKAKKAAAATDFVHRLSGKMHFNSTSIMRPKGFKANVAKMKKSFSRELVK